MGKFQDMINSRMQELDACGWGDFFRSETAKEYFCDMADFLDGEFSNCTCFPPLADIFSAFTIIPIEKIAVVLLGQDPYHEKNQAMGLAFAVPKSEKIPPSLRNIYKELKSDLNIERQNGDISDWARNGVFLINTVLSVREGQANSHAKCGWKIFTKNAVTFLAQKNPSLVFLLLGKQAEEFAEIAREFNHAIITAPHPSPLSAHRGFFGSQIFSKVNTAVGLDIFS